jgi:V8-like Glu-specific endopeptidase
MRTTALLCFLSLFCAIGFAGKDQRMPEPGPVRVGRGMTYSFSPDLRQYGWQEGRRIWSKVLRIPDAAFLKIHFASFQLRPGDALLLRKGEMIVETLTGFGPKNTRSFWSLASFGEEVTLELRFSADYEGLPFAVDEILVGDPALLAGVTGGPESICPPPDYEDVICYQGDPEKWANVLASVGVMTVGGNPTTALWCSGSNVSPNNYLLTNYHCIPQAGTCANSEFVFKYYRTSCGGGGTTPDWQSFRCDQTVASSPIGDCDPDLSSLDFSLNSVLGDPNATFGHVNVDSNPLTSGEEIYIIQHPDGRPHEIAHGSGADVVVDGHTVRYYNTLDTEGGSSGSPLFRAADHKLVGLHHCGGCSDAGVGNRGMLLSEIYPQIASYLCTGSVFLAPAGNEALEEVTGNGDSLVDPGETWSFLPKVVNRACSQDASDVAGTIQLGAACNPDVVLLDSVALFGTVLHGETVVAQSPVRFSVSSTASCTNDFIFDLVQISATGFSPFAGGQAIQGSLGGTETTILWSESFSGAFPGSWTLTDLGTGTGPASTWTTANPGNRSLLNPPFAICDSDNLGSGQTMDETMTSPLIDLTTAGSGSLILQFSHDFKAYSSGQNEQCDVDLRSSATAGNWVNLYKRTGSQGSSSGVVQIDISAYAAADVQIRFHYYQATYEYWWAVDDIAIVESEQLCGPSCVSQSQFETMLGSWPAASVIDLLQALATLCP